MWESGGAGELPADWGRQNDGTGRRQHDPPDPETTSRERSGQRARQCSNDRDETGDGGERQRDAWDDRPTNLASFGELDVDTRMEDARRSGQRPPGDASFTTDNRGAYRLLQNLTTEGADDGDRGSQDEEDQASAAGQGTIVAVDMDLSWD